MMYLQVGLTKVMHMIMDPKSLEEQYLKQKLILVIRCFLATAKINAEKNNVNVTFLLADILKTTDLNEEFDIIVSNPPYIRNLEKEEIKKNVLAYEPHLALFVADDNALIFYRKIAALAQKHLAKAGYLYYEINQYLGKETVALLESFDFKNTQLRKDIYGNDRMTKSQKLN